MIARIDDHAARAVARLLEQYRDKPLLAGLVSDVVAGLQDLESAAWDVQDARPLDAAQGAVLDDLGSLVGFARQGLDDATYRVVLRGVIGENNSDATRAAALTILDGVFQPQAVFAHNRLPRGSVGYNLIAPAVDPSIYSLMRSVFARSLAGGVDLAFLGVHGTRAFAMAGPQSWVRGFGGGPPASVNLLTPNVATGGDVMGNAPEFVSCVSLEPFGASGADALVSYVSTDATGDPSTAWEGAGAVSVHTSGGAAMGAKFTQTGLVPGLDYTFSYYAFNWGGFGAQAWPQIYSPGGIVDITYQTGGTAISAFGWSRFTATFTQPASYDSVELRIVETTDSSYSWLLDGLQLEQAFSASAWTNPTPASTPEGGGFAGLIT